MFTGIIQAIGTVERVETERGDRRVFIRVPFDLSQTRIGASIACSGVCLTVVDKGEDWFAADVSAETISRTAMRDWGPGARINLEPSLKAGDEMGGHIVTGHVDGVAEIRAIDIEGDSHRLTMEVPEDLAPFIASKGSVALDGVSLTVNEVAGAQFGVNIIPHTWIHTTLGDRKKGDVMHLEVDIMARYVARVRAFERESVIA